MKSCQIGSVQEDHKVPQRYPKTEAYIANLDAKLYQMLLICLKRLI